MRYLSILLLLGTLTIAGCSYKKMDTSLQSLEGQDIDVAIYYLGIPDEKYMIEDRSVYIWGSEEPAVARNPVTTFGGYNSGGGAFGGVGVVFGAPYGRSYSQYYCKIKMIADGDQIIQQVERDSTAGACSKYNEAVGVYR